MMLEYVSFGIVSFVLVMLYAPGCTQQRDYSATGAGQAVISENEGGTVADGTGTPGDTETLDAEEAAFLTRINAYRAENDLAPLKRSQTLTAASSWLANDMAAKDYFSHYDSLGQDSFSRMERFGYDDATTMGENIAAGNESAEATFQQWRSSSGHNANMLSAAYRDIGIGRAYRAGADYGWYWVTDFGTSKSQ